jgi:hypothetical protein
MMDEKPTTFAEEIKRDDDLLRRRFVHATRPNGPLSLNEAIALHKRMEGDEPVQCGCGLTEPCSICAQTGRFPSITIS